MNRAEQHAQLERMAAKLENFPPNPSLLEGQAVCIRASCERLYPADSDHFCEHGYCEECFAEYCLLCRAEEEE